MKNKIILFSQFCILTMLFAISPVNAHADNEPEQKVVDIIWVRTSEPVGAKNLPVASWSWSDVEDINCKKTTGVWDGGAIGNHYIKDVAREWDIATWHTNRAYWSGTCDVRRFYGEFTIPDGYSASDNTTLSSVGDYTELGLENIIAINDNIYVFVYPKDQEINDGNYMEFLAFWTGTACQEAARAVNGGELITFHGIPGTVPYDYKDIVGNPIPKENLLSHTDGWYCEATNDNVGHIMKNSPNVTEFAIDLIVEDYAEDGGMDRMDLIFVKTSEGEAEPQSTPPTNTPYEPSTAPSLPTNVRPSITPPDFTTNESPTESLPESEIPPTAPGEILVPQDDGSYEMIDEDGIPLGGLIPIDDGYEVVDTDGTALGSWHKNDRDDWVYADLPQTGGVSISLMALAAGAVMVEAGILLRRYKS